MSAVVLILCSVIAILACGLIALLYILGTVAGGYSR